MVSIHSFPRAIIHLDGDAFFASCEQSRNPVMRGKPVITGKERGIASSMSYEAKQRGVVRGMRLFEIRHVCPDAIILPSDYEYYSMISKRFMTIVRRYTPDVEEYSIDECFADITGMRRPLHMSYEQIITRIQRDIEQELGVSFSAGLGPNKVIAKMASKWKKPRGTTIIPAKDIHRYLAQLPLSQVWGIGKQTCAYLQKYGITNALQFANTSETWIVSKLSKPFYEIWCELNGQCLLSLNTAEKKHQLSIQKVKTFSPSSHDRNFLFSQLSKNIENACIKARRYGLAAQRIALYLRTHDFHHVGTEIALPYASAFAHEMVDMCEKAFSTIFNPSQEYRASGVVLSQLDTASCHQLDLFGRHQKAQALSRLYDQIDYARMHYGKYSIFLASSVQSMRKKTTSHVERNELPERFIDHLRGETFRRHINIPILTQHI